MLSGAGIIEASAFKFSSFQTEIIAHDPLRKIFDQYYFKHPFYHLFLIFMKQLSQQY